MIKRRLYQSVLALSLLTVPLTNVVHADQSTSSTQSSQLSVTINGDNLKSDVQPVFVKDRVFVELRPIVEALGATVNWDNGSQTATVTKASSTIQVQVGTYFAEKDGTSVQLDEKPQLLNNRVMVPVRFVSEGLGAVVRWHPESNTVAIYNNVNTDTDSTNTPPVTYTPTSISGNTGVSSTTVTSGTSSTTYTNNTSQSTTPTNLNSLSLQDAQNLAYNSSWTLKTSLDNVEISNEGLKQASDNIGAGGYIPSSGGNSSATSAFTRYAQANSNVQINQKTAELTQDTIGYAVKQAYNGVLQALQNDKFNQIALQNAATQQQIKQAQFQNGTASAIDVATAKTAYDQAQSAVAQGQTTITKAYQVFNQLVGLPIDARPQLTDVPQMTKLDNTVDLDTKVSQVVSESPSIFNAEQQVNLANLSLKLYTFNNPAASNTYEGTQKSVDVAQNNVQALTNSLSQTVRTLYSNIKQSEQQYDALQSAIQLDQQNLQVAQAKYDAGVGIKADLQAAQYNLEKDKNSLFNLTVQHDNNLMQFDKPWVGGGSGN